MAAYEAMLERLRDEGGRRARLSVNYRSSQAVLDEVERLVEPSMRAQAGLQQEFQPLLEGRRAQALPAALFASGRRAVEHWSSDRLPGAQGRWLAEDARGAEARRIAGELAELAEGGVELERCAILLRTATQQEIYLAALREAGVPYAVGKDKGYFQTREVVDAVALVACLLDPSDALSLLVFLRSPLCGVPDAALAPLWRLGLPEHVARLDGSDPQALEAALALLPRAEAAARQALAAGERGSAALARVDGWRLCAESGLRALAALRADLAVRSADRVVERLRATLCPEVSEAARFPGAHRLANLEQFFAHLVEALAQGRGGAAGVLRELRAGLSGEREARSAAPDEVGERAVRVLTVHSAKGLQFRSVWLADLSHGTGWGDRRAPAAVVQREGDLCAIELFGAAGLERTRLAARREAVEAAESVRLLYVAATRAEDRLVLSGQIGSADEARSLADLVARRAGLREIWSELADSYPTGQRAELERDGTRFVLAAAPPERPAAERRRGSGRTPAPLPARAVDAGRAARPLHAAISSSPRAHERAQREFEEGRGGVRRDAARAVGVALHAALQSWPVGRPDAPEIARAALERALAARVGAAELEDARRAALALLDAFAASALARRLDALAGRFFARELPLLLGADGEDGPTGAWVGAADLVYEEHGALVVVDFKTDGGLDDAALLSTYRPQLELYARALRAALGRPVVRAELWRLGLGRCVDVSLA
jgi:ATP-dependent helicase/nuclease subunit A